MKVFLFGLATLLFMACKQPQKQAVPKPNEKEMITYFTYGELPPVGYIYYDTVLVLAKYRLNVKNMGGCEPDGIDYKDLEHRNKQTAQYMAKQFGKDWVKDFEKQTKLKIMLSLDLED
ncbi:FEKKY domain-containing protein [Pedobacter ureilyticus]|uniref:DUF4907 domain-containing protein n=1 Tax=Pedobacter ureilyticus TaxID=1393051 RepID=A0ABW9J313_9SPHI|nr:hypothetical protein [Pedobacter helvus]